MQVSHALEIMLIKICDKIQTLETKLFYKMFIIHCFHAQSKMNKLQNLDAINSENVHHVGDYNKKMVLDFVMANYWTQEHFSRAMNLHLEPEAVAELRPFTEMLIDQGHSLCFMHGDTIAGVSLNVVQTSESSPELYVKFAEECSHPSSKAVMEFIMDLEEYDEYIFAQCGTECYLEIICIATCEAYKGLGIAGCLFRETVQYAKKLKRDMHDDMKFAPGAVVAECTSNLAKKITDKLNFRTLLDMEAVMHKWAPKCIGTLTTDTILKLQVLEI